MIPLLTAAEMSRLEQEAISAWGISSLVLQEHAALGALALIPPGQPIQVLAGPGNNGGDALALARLARLQGRAVSVWVLEEPRWKGDAAIQAGLWTGLGGAWQLAADPAGAVAGFRGWVVDGLFGLGVRLPLRGPALAWVAAVRAVRAQAAPGAPPFRVLALDLPSGLDPSSPEAGAAVLAADRTACFGQRKLCHGLRPARDLCGEITVVPIPLRQPAAAAVQLRERPGRLVPQIRPPWRSTIRLQMAGRSRFPDTGPGCAVEGRSRIPCLRTFAQTRTRRLEPRTPIAPAPGRLRYGFGTADPGSDT